MASQLRYPPPARRGTGARISIAADELGRFLSRELHDRVAQTLTAMLVELEDFRREQVGRLSVLDEVDRLEDSIRQVMTSLRELLQELRGESQVLTEPFSEMVSRLLVDFQRQTGIEARLTVDEGWPALVKPSAATNLCRIIGEALANVRRHSGASRVVVALQSQGGTIVSVSVTDDGRGFELSDAGRRGLGIAGMNERALLLGASLQMSTHDDLGTTVLVSVPVGAVSQPGPG